MSQNFVINHISYTLAELLQKCKETISSNVPDWEREVWAFVKEWLNDEDTVQVTTSGSTGVPKTIAIEKKYLRNSAMMTLAFLGLKPGDVALLCLSASYIAGKMMIVRALEGGLDLLLKEALGNPLKGNTEKIHFAAMVPLQVEKVLAEEGAEVLASIDQLIIGGAAVNDSLLRQLNPLSNATWATYGMTETVSHVAMKRLSGEAVLDCFVPMPGIKLSIDERGCLQIEGPHLCAETVVTNDLVTLDEQQCFRFVGRYDNIINSGGVKLVPELIEQKITSLFDERFIISSLSDDRLGQKLVLYVETTEPERYDWSLLQEQLADLLPPFQRPKVLICLPKFAETKSGKVKRSF